MEVPKQTYDLLSNPDASLDELNAAYKDLVQSAIEQGRDPNKNGFVLRFAAYIEGLPDNIKPPREVLAGLDARAKKRRGKKGPEQRAHERRVKELDAKLADIAMIGHDFAMPHPHEPAYTGSLPLTVEHGLVLTKDEANARQL